MNPHDDQNLRFDAPARPEARAYYEFTYQPNGSPTIDFIVREGDEEIFRIKDTAVHPDECLTKIETRDGVTLYASE